MVHCTDVFSVKMVMLGYDKSPLLAVSKDLTLGDIINKLFVTNR